MLKAADANGDGTIDYTEFLAAAFQKDLLLSSQNLRAAFELFDGDTEFIGKTQVRTKKSNCNLTLHPHAPSSFSSK